MIMGNIEATIKSEQARLQSQLSVRAEKVSSQAQILQSLQGIYKDQKAALEHHRSLLLEAAKMEIDSAQTRATTATQRMGLAETSAKIAQESVKARQNSQDRLTQVATDASKANTEIAAKNQAVKNQFRDKSGNFNPKYYQVQAGQTAAFTTPKARQDFEADGDALVKLIPKVQQLSKFIVEGGRFDNLTPEQRTEFKSVYASALVDFKNFYGFGAAFSGSEQLLAKDQLPDEDLAMVFTDAQTRIGPNTIRRLVADHKVVADKHFINLGPEFLKYVPDTTRAE
jgi:hypothetical protein